MSTILDLAIALSLKDMVTGQIGHIINEFKGLEGVTDEVKEKLNDFKNIGMVGGAVFGAGAFGLDKTLETLDMVTESASNMEDALTVFENKAFGKSVVSDIEEVRSQVDMLSRDIKEKATGIALNTSFNEVEILNSMTALSKGGIGIDIDDKGTSERFKNIAEANAYFAMINRVSAESTADGTAKMAAGFRLVGNEVMDVMEIANRWADSTSNDVLAIMNSIGAPAGTASTIWDGVLKPIEVAEQAIGLTAMTGNMGFSEAEAATAVKSFLLAANATGGELSKSKAAAMQNLGFFDGNGKSVFIDQKTNALKTVSEIEKIIEDAKGRMNNDELTINLNAVFGERGQKVAFALADTSGLNDFDVLSASAQNALSIMDQVEREMGLLSNVKGIFNETIESLKITVGTPFLEPFKNAFQGLTNILAVANRYFAEHPQVAKYIFMIAGSASAFLIVIGAIMGVIAAVGSLKLVWGIAGKAIIGSMAPVAGVMLPVIGVVAALAAAGYLIYRNWDTIGPIVKNVGNSFKGTFGFIKSIFSGSIDIGSWFKLVDFLERLGLSAGDAMETAQAFTKFILTIKNITDIAIGSVKLIISILSGHMDMSAWKNLIGLFEKLGFSSEEATKIVQDFTKGIIAVKDAFTKVKGIIAAAINILSGFVRAVFNEIEDFLAEWGPTIGEIFLNVFEIIAILAKVIFKTARDFFINTFTVAKVIFGALKVFWEEWGPAITVLFQGTLNNLVLTFDTAFNIIRILAGYALGTISNIIKFILAIIKGDWDGAWNAVKDQFDLTVSSVLSIAEVFEKYLTGILKNIKDTVIDAWSALKGFLGFKSDAKEALEEPIQMAVTTEKNVVENISVIPSVETISQEEILRQSGLDNETFKAVINVVPDIAVDTQNIDVDGLGAELGLENKEFSIPVGADTSLALEQLADMDFNEMMKQYGLDEGFSVPANIDTSLLAEQMEGLPADLGASGTEVGVAFANGFNDPQVIAATKAAAETISNTITDNLIKDDDMRIWGCNLIESFIAGMKSKFGALEQAARDAAALVGDYMKVQSPTRKGDLSTNNLWGGNLIRSFADGMTRNGYLLQSASAFASGNISLNGTAALNFKQYDIPDFRLSQAMDNDMRIWNSNRKLHDIKLRTIDESDVKIKRGGVYEKNSAENAAPIYIQIYTQPNHDENKIADTVIKKLEKQNKGKATASRPSLTMSANGSRRGY